MNSSNNNDDELYPLLSKPPVNLLFNPTLVSKKGIWSISISYLLERFLSILESMKSKDLRLCGVAALSSAVIFRLKVESIFLLERIASQRKQAIREGGISSSSNNSTVDVSSIAIQDMPYRHEAAYDLTLEDLLEMLSSIVERIYLGSKQGAEMDVSIEPVTSSTVDSYIITLENIIDDYKSRLYALVMEQGGNVSFNHVTLGLEPIEVARYFMALLHLCIEGKVEIVEVVHGDDDNNKGCSADDISISLRASTDQL
ncbi:MAG: hypothetical protein QW574_03990 [Candidatus Nitrosocaldus sp.]